MDKSKESQQPIALEIVTINQRLKYERLRQNGQCSTNNSGKGKGVWYSLMV